MDSKSNYKEKSAKVYIVYDLGIDGDYAGLYSWLDKNKAMECGDSVARINDYKYNGKLTEFIKEDLKKNVKLRKKDRVYMITYNNEKMIGGFLFGRRKISPWTGYYHESVEEDKSEWDDDI